MKEWCNWSPSTASQFARIGAEYPKLFPRRKSLPCNWTTLGEIATLTADVIDKEVTRDYVQDGR